MQLDLGTLEKLRAKSVARSERIKTEADRTTSKLGTIKAKYSELSLKLKEMQLQPPSKHPKANEFFSSVKNQDQAKVHRLLSSFPELISQVDSVRPN